jgi:hypothetical protein
MLFFIITGREEVFPESYCWALEECTTQALRRAGWSAEPWVQKVVRCRPPNSLTTQAPTSPLRRPPPSNFVLVEVLLPHAKPAAEKEAFWAEFRAGVEARLPSIEPDIALRFVEMLGENVYFKRKAQPL